MLSNAAVEKVELNGLNCIADLIQETCEKFADKPAYTCLGKTHSFKEIDQLSAAFASYLQNHTELKPGDKIAIQLPSITQFPIAAYGATRAGLVLVNTNPLYTPREMLHQFNNSEATALIILSDLLPVAEKVLPDTNIKTVITTHAADLLAPQEQGSAQLSTISLLDAIALGESTAYKPVTAHLDDLAVLQYTGGTTGLSKGAMLSQSNVLSNTFQTKSRLTDVISEGKETLVSPLPLYHIYAFNITLLLYFSTGAHSILIPNPRDMPGFINAIKTIKFTAFSGLNTLFVGLCTQPEFKALDFSQLRITTSGGTALTTSTADLWKEVTGCDICEGYGLSETAPVVTFNRPGETLIGSIGAAVPGTEIKLLDENDNEVGAEQAGELAVRGPQVMQGYWRSDAATAEVMTADGYFKTGDIAEQLDNGYYKIVDRKKDMIIVSGFNVYPNEVEEILSSHTGILEAAVIGVQSEKSGEAVKAFIVKSPQKQDLAEGDVIAHCRDFLTSYKVPKQIVFIDELPKTAVGKILRRELRTL
ncbi:AMP-binding protein [Moritella sp. 24]|uniref:AMP-binding protein n=1 Tax=Moritella sp. 24 TaxID=2746230 RepID=UPI001BACA943|nr:AMP-binding protein [Moritella sp. 24]QUM76012.1 AMP-binding protein [Moritella sp. 24]